MLRWLINNRLSAAERDLGAPLDYLRHIARVSLRAFFKFAKIMPLANFRRRLPPEAYFAARIVATRYEDCGPCLQIEVNLAKKAGVDPALLQLILDEKVDQLPEDVAEAYRFATEVMEKRDPEELRNQLQKRYGEEGIIELSMAIAICRVFPTTKRGLGYAKSCSAVTVEV